MGDRKVGPNFSSSIKFHLLVGTMTENISRRCRPRTATSVIMCEKSDTEYVGARTFYGHKAKFGYTASGDNKKFYMFTVGFTI